ncbi:MAG: UDP-3-O-acyl-N-acetylglucosamine deacetylase [Spirochaetales bacterium]|nr:UDP-3-O-acyl-N-acetylglucosamine deacetylase [Leptospiraceae bacterium]MCP5481619.1 UDP-3-O-acyl-N-acetylglucosamine deacetylase [Spirochaetales bacterium]MCP5484447.1 UDP-3-O-acyl-N-acetylglucosamine deacetylase [Spirochaetales bacterium]
MKLVTDSTAIAELKAHRHAAILEMPPHFRAPVPGFEQGRRYVPDRPVDVQGVSSFENQPVRIRLSPPGSATPVFSWNEASWELKSENLKLGEHNIQLGDIKIIEHPIALMSALNVDFDISMDQSSFPTFERCDLPYLHALQDNLRDAGQWPWVTVNKAFALTFEEGYVILEPERERPYLTVDHQIRYPGSAIGTQRLVTEITAERFAFFGQARTPSFRSREETLQILEMAKAGLIKDFPVSPENIFFVDPEHIHNPRPEFEHNGHNYEFMLHELIDITSWLKLVDLRFRAKFVARMTSFLFGHGPQIEAARFLCLDPEFEPIGMSKVLF